MSRLYDVMLDAPLKYQPKPAVAPSRPHPMVYQGEFTGTVYLQFLGDPASCIVIGKDLLDVEHLRDRLDAFLQGAWRDL